MIRIGSYATQNYTLKHNLDSQARIREAQVQISSGKKAQNYNGISADVRRLEDLETRHAKTSAFAKSADRTDKRLAEMETVVGQLQDIASQFRSKLLQAASGGNLDSTNIQGEAETMLTEVAGLLNTDYEGRYLFGGSVTDQAPIQLDNGGTPLPYDDGSVNDIESGAYYQGNAQTLAARVDSDVTLDYGITADPNTDTGFHDLISALSRVANPAAALSDEVDSAISDLSDPNNGAIKRLADTIADIGSSRDILQRTTQRLEDNQLNAEEGISDIENVDVATAVTQLSGHQMTLESSYAVTARIANLSLLNYMR